MTAAPALDEGAASEHALLGAALTFGGDVVARAAGRVVAEDFGDPLHRAAWAAACELQASGQPVDVVTVWEALAEGRAAEPGALRHLNEVAQVALSGKNVEAYAERISDRSLRRRVGAAVQLLAAASSQPGSGFDLLREAEQALAPLRQRAEDRALQNVANFEHGAVSRFPLLTSADLAARPPVTAVLKGLVHEGDIGAIHGSWGDGKSFIALDMLRAMSDGVDWFGYRCRRPVPCLYVGLEGQASVPKRVKALQAEKASELEGLRFLLTSLDIRSQLDREQLIASIRAHGFAGGALCLDTFNASTLGMAENTSEDMGQAIAAAKHLQREFGGVVILVHHSGKNRDQGMRGHSSLEGAVDFIIEVARDAERKAAPRKLVVRKVKDGQDGAEFAFDLRQVDLGTDDDSDPVTSAVVVRVLTDAERAANHVDAMVLEVVPQPAAPNCDKTQIALVPIHKRESQHFVRESRRSGVFEIINNKGAR